ncbi:hypothetical protein FN976_08205 [Caenimonas sedimenti]|uniref:Uncharacterized protein n=1 Tax=Caenimonas sedimenti TaxID=2596921 RepID=A0A562ZUE7_9BURK|nr:hypothetical protein [Caenimonas sedimenti]TWO71958.1 hypothetical protein FN976_08205 [Caenimonas sedimenti]
MKKSLRDYFKWFDQCGKARQSRILPTGGTALHAIPRGSRRAGRLQMTASKTARSIAQRSLLCGQDPALPGLTTPIRSPENCVSNFPVHGYVETRTGWS